MQITLCEDDSVLNNGVPTMVVIVVKFDDGQQKRLPYLANKSIAELYKSLNTITPKFSSPLVEAKTEAMIKTVEDNFIGDDYIKDPEFPIAAQIKKETKDRSNIIEKEDFVTIVKLEDRGEGATVDLAVGMECRVLKVHKSGVTLPGSDEITDLVKGYDVVNDKSLKPERTFVFAHEVVLARKRNPAPKAVKPKIEEILQCPNCGDQVACALEGDVFKGDCFGCKSSFEIKRKIGKCKTKGCGKDVSLFLYDKTYKGICNACKSHLKEVSK